MIQPAQPSSRDRASNVVLWLAFALTHFLVGGVFVVELHRRFDRDASLAVTGLLARTALYVSLGLLLESLLLRAGDGYLTVSKKRRSVLHVLWVLVMLLSVGLIVDVVVFAFAGYHLTTAVAILFADGPAGVGKVVDATGLSPSVVLFTVAALAVGLGLATGLSKLSRRVSLRAKVLISRRTALRAALVSMGTLAIVETVSYHVRNPFIWDREIRSVPLAFAIVRPAAEIASFRVTVARPEPAAQVRAPSPAHLPEEPKPDIFFFMVESLRHDVLVPELMPATSAFARDAWTFEHSITAGNVTHYSWYGLFCGALPIFFESTKHSPERHGSIPLTVLREAGYRIHLFATPDTEYQQIESIVFGPGGRLLNTKFHPAAKSTAQRDDAVIGELSRRLGVDVPGGNVYIVALDSTHFGYDWGAGFTPIFLPYASDISIARDYQLDAKARSSVVNRYKNAVRWMDSLLARFFEKLESSGRLPRSLIVITGDHGEAFWEHGTGTHGSKLDSEQLEVAFAMKVPATPGRHFDSVFSLVDVMPTVLDEVGLQAAAPLDGIAWRKRLGGDPAALAVPGKTADAAAMAPHFALSFQGWNERGFRFSLTSPETRLLFELDQVDPLLAHRLVLKDVTDLRDVSLVAGEGGQATDAYRDVLRNLAPIMDSMPFLKL